MTSRTAQFVRAYESVAADTPLADRRNMAFDEAMEADCCDPVAAEAFARSRAYGDLLCASLARTDDMLTRAECCGVAKVFCACEPDCLARYGYDIFAGDE